MIDNAHELYTARGSEGYDEAFDRWSSKVIEIEARLIKIEPGVAGGSKSVKKLGAQLERYFDWKEDCANMVIYWETDGRKEGKVIEKYWKESTVSEHNQLLNLAALFLECCEERNENSELRSDAEATMKAVKRLNDKEETAETGF